ncbi:hypothetical protein [Methylobacterium nigriterrae]|uniref:hypothetical protein n=1 Tax=Methylobacterium nigriterrae TaxID=3127512 RepID=UPI003013C31D
MGVALDRSHDIAEVDRYLAEGARLIAQAEARRRQIDRDCAREGHRLMAAQILTAMRRTLRLIEDHRIGLAAAATDPALAPVRAGRARWWPAFVRRRGYHQRIL